MNGDLIRAERNMQCHKLFSAKFHKVSANLSARIRIYRTLSILTREIGTPFFEYGKMTMSDIFDYSLGHHIYKYSQKANYVLSE